MGRSSKAVLLGCIVALTCFFSGCSSKGKIIHIATKPMTEQYVIGSMVKKLIEQDTDLSVDITFGVGGGTSNIEPAMESGKFDLYPEYTGTGWSEVLKNSGVYSENSFDQLQTGYQKLDMTWVGMLGFNDTYGIAVTREVAEKYRLSCISDLAGAADQLKFGAEYDYFEREDGYKALCNAYGIQFGSTMDLDIGLKYDAIQQKQIDAMNIFTTDGKLSSSDVVVLKDDKSIYPSYKCGFVIRDKILEEHPELKRVFEKMQDLISDQQMAEMNYQVESDGKDPETVAAEFLKTKGLLK